MEEKVRHLSQSMAHFMIFYELNFYLVSMYLIFIRTPTIEARQKRKCDSQKSTRPRAKRRRTLNVKLPSNESSRSGGIVPLEEMMRLRDSKQERRGFSKTLTSSGQRNANGSTHLLVKEPPAQGEESTGHCQGKVVT